MHFLFDKYTKTELIDKYQQLSKEYEFKEYQLRSLVENLKVLEQQGKELQEELSQITKMQDILMVNIEQSTDLAKESEEKAQ